MRRKYITKTESGIIVVQTENNFLKQFEKECLICKGKTDPLMGREYHCERFHRRCPMCAHIFDRFEETEEQKEERRGFPNANMCNSCIKKRKDLIKIREKILKVAVGFVSVEDYPIVVERIRHYFPRPYTEKRIKKFPMIRSVTKFIKGRENEFKFLEQLGYKRL